MGGIGLGRPHLFHRVWPIPAAWSGPPRQLNPHSLLFCPASLLPHRSRRTDTPTLPMGKGGGGGTHAARGLGAGHVHGLPGWALRVGWDRRRPAAGARADGRGRRGGGGEGRASWGGGSYCHALWPWLTGTPLTLLSVWVGISQKKTRYWMTLNQRTKMASCEKVWVTMCARHRIKTLRLIPFTVGIVGH